MDKYEIAMVVTGLMFMAHLLADAIGIMYILYTALVLGSAAFMNNEQFAVRALTMLFATIFWFILFMIAGFMDEEIK